MKKIIAIVLSLILALSTVPVFAAGAAPEIEAEAALLMDMTTGEILYEKNSHEKMYPASTTKMLTAILALENLDTTKEIIVKGKDVKGITGDKLDLRDGEKLSIGVMLTAMMVISANDAAVVLANEVSGSVKEFAELMNAKAIEIGCSESNFVNPNGLHDKNHYSTASDLAKIAVYCMQNEVFRRVVARPELTIAPTNIYPYRYLTNTNKLLNEDLYPGCIGIKTGTTTPAGGCLVAAATKGDTTLLSVVLKSSDNGRFSDTRALFDWGFANYKTVNILGDNVDLGTIKVKKGAEKSVAVEYAGAACITLPVDSQKELKTKITLEKYLTAPFDAGTVCGTLEVLDGDKVVETFNLTTADAVLAKGDKSAKKDKTNKDVAEQKNQNPGDPKVGISISWLTLIEIVVGGGLGLLILSFIIYMIYQERQAAKRKARRMARRKELAERDQMLRAEYQETHYDKEDNEL